MFATPAPAPAPQMTELAGRRLHRSATTLLLLTCLMVVLVVVLLSWREREQALRDARASNTNVALSALRFFQDNVQLADSHLRDVAELLDERGPHRRRPTALEDELMRRTVESGAMAELHVLDAQGLLLGSSSPAHRGTPAQGWAAFARHRDSARDDVLVGAALRSPLTGRWVVPVSRRLSRPDGSFAGVVLAGLDLEHLGRHLQGFDLGADGAIALLHREGVYIARWPWRPSVPGLGQSNSPLQRPEVAHLPRGSLTAPSPVDGRERQYSFVRSREMPLTAVVGVSTQDALAGWRANVVSQALLCVVLTAALGLGGLRLLRNVGQEQTLVHRLAASHRRLADLELAINAQAIVAVTDARGTILQVNDNFSRICGHAREALLGQDHRKINSGTHDVAFFADMWRTIGRGEVWRGEVCNHARDGRLVWVDSVIVPVLGDDGRPEKYISIGSDITARRHEAEQLRAQQESLAATAQAMARMAAMDELTGLANRRQFNQSLTEEHRRARRGQQPLSLLIVDVDFFKLYNDRYGHPAGDACLAAVAEVLREVARRPGDVAARYGGEEFAVLLPDTIAEGAALVAERLRQAVVQRALPHAGHPLGVVTVSIGMHTVRPAEDGCMPAQLVESADQALYHAKRAGRNCCQHLALPPTLPMGIDTETV